MTTPLADADLTFGQATPGGPRVQRVARNVIAALGEPPHLYRVTVVPLWGDYFRVNVVTGADPTAVRIPHSFFVKADARGTLVESTPPVPRVYAPRPLPPEVSLPPIASDC